MTTGATRLLVVPVEWEVRPLADGDDVIDLRCWRSVGIRSWPSEGALGAGLQNGFDTMYAGARESVRRKHVFFLAASKFLTETSPLNEAYAAFVFREAFLLCFLPTCRW
jgi:hypothetical protein